MKEIQAALRPNDEEFLEDLEAMIGRMFFPELRKDIERQTSNNIRSPFYSQFFPQPRTNPTPSPRAWKEIRPRLEDTFATSLLIQDPTTNMSYVLRLGI